MKLNQFRRRVTLDSGFRRNDAFLLLGIALFCFWARSAEATDPQINPALCRNRVEYSTPPGVDYQPGVDAEGHYVAPADMPGSASPQLPKKINIPLTLGLAKSLNMNTGQYPANQFGEGAEIPLGTLSVENNQVTLNGKSLSNEQQDRLAALCAKQGM